MESADRPMGPVPEAGHAVAVGRMAAGTGEPGEGGRVAEMAVVIMAAVGAVDEPEAVVAMVDHLVDEGPEGRFRPAFDGHPGDGDEVHRLRSPPTPGPPAVVAERVAASRPPDHGDGDLVGEQAAEEHAVEEEVGPLEFGQEVGDGVGGGFPHALGPDACLALPELEQPGPEPQPGARRIPLAEAAVGGRGRDLEVGGELVPVEAVAPL
jgi:hypothetical protein